MNKPLLPGLLVGAALLLGAVSLTAARCTPDTACTDESDCVVSCRCPGRTTDLLVSHACSGGFCVSSYLEDLECTAPCSRVPLAVPPDDDDSAESGR